MGIRDLFKSKRERDRDLKKHRRKAFREAESAVDVVKDRVVKMKKEHDASWMEARKYLREGQKIAAHRCLQSCRASDMMIAKLQMKRWVFEQLLTRLELAKTDQEFSQALGALNAVIQIDPEQVADVLDEVEDKLGEQVDTDKIWEKMYGKEMEGVESRMTEVVPSIEELSSQLEDEVAAEIGEARRAAPESAKDASLDEKISEGRKRLKELLEDDK